MNPAISKVRHPTKYGCLKLCIDKESRGFECISPITKKVAHQKYFRRKGTLVEFLHTDQDVYYEAIYKKVFY
ncbi:hypothetical protein AFL42_07235 [Oceanobacillus caeni]|uniref:Uncharacterized protein n=1 Tax=Oceanobacillus caeni TaxID=405946 RepID=A0ABR5MK36_9BACI|nr:hypothetical protein AFL42_07235 [Oceanobacillus caeni]